MAYRNQAHLPQEFTERVHLTGIIQPDPVNNFEGYIEVEVISMDDIQNQDSELLHDCPAIYDFVIMKGATCNVLFTITNRQDGKPIDISKYTYSGKAVLINNNSIEYDLHPTRTDDGKLEILLTPEETDAFVLNECTTYYHYHINFIDNNNTVYRIIMGNIQLCQ